MSSPQTTEPERDWREFDFLALLDRPLPPCPNWEEWAEREARRILGLEE